MSNTEALENLHIEDMHYILHVLHRITLNFASRLDRRRIALILIPFVVFFFINHFLKMGSWFVFFLCFGFPFIPYKSVYIVIVLVIIVVMLFVGVTTACLLVCFDNVVLPCFLLLSLLLTNSILEMEEEENHLLTVINQWYQGSRIQKLISARRA